MLQKSNWASTKQLPAKQPLSPGDQAHRHLMMMGGMVTGGQEPLHQCCTAQTCQRRRVQRNVTHGRAVSTAGVADHKHTTFPFPFLHCACLGPRLGPHLRTKRRPLQHMSQPSSPYHLVADCAWPLRIEQRTHTPVDRGHCTSAPSLTLLTCAAPGMVSHHGPAALAVGTDDMASPGHTPNPVHGGHIHTRCTSKPGPAAETRQAAPAQQPLHPWWKCRRPLPFHRHVQPGCKGY
jgi:hypothetical protein